MDVDRLARYARLLGRVFPLGHNKRPLRGSHPKADAVDPTAAVIANQLEQHAAYGIYLDPDVVVLDADSVAGVEALRVLGLPRTVAVKPKRGFHFAFSDPTGRLRGRRQFLPGVDLVAHTGAPWYVVGPGSRHPDGPIYEIVEGTDILETGTLPTVPDWVYEEAARTTKRPLSTQPVNVTSNPSIVPSARLGQIAATFSMTRKGARHARLLDLAVYLRATGADRETLERLCADAAASRCDPPFTSHADRRDLERIISWALKHAGVAGHTGGDILDTAIWYAKQWPAPVRGTQAYQQLAAIAMFLGELSDPTFALPQTRLASALHLSQFGVSLIIDRIVQAGLLLRDSDDYQPGVRSKLYRLPGREDDARPPRLRGLSHDDDTEVRVVFDGRRQCYEAVPIPSSPFTTESTGVSLSPVLFDRVHGAPPSPDEIRHLRARIPYAGPDSDFDRVTLGELRARQAARATRIPPAVVEPPAIGSVPSPAAPRTPPPRRRRKTTASQPRREWESGSRSPSSEAAHLIDPWQPNDPLLPWAWPELERVLPPICALSFTRGDLVAILDRVFLMIERRPRVGLALALALDVIATQIAVNKTRLWRMNRGLCDRARSKVAPEIPRSQRVDTLNGDRWKGVGRPTLHIAVAILTADGLLSAHELAEIRAQRPQRAALAARPSAETGPADTAGANAVWPDSYTFRAEELQMLLAMERLPLWRARGPRVHEARAVLVRELRRMGVSLSAVGTRAPRGVRRRRRVSPSLHEAIALLARNGAGSGLGRLEEESSRGAAA